MLYAGHIGSVIKLKNEEDINNHSIFSKCLMYLFFLAVKILCKTLHLRCSTGF